MEIILALNTEESANRTPGKRYSIFFLYFTESVFLKKKLNLLDDDLITFPCNSRIYLLSI